jgi:hypothetical protein
LNQLEFLLFLTKTGFKFLKMVMGAIHFGFGAIIIGFGAIPPCFGAIT